MGQGVRKGRRQAAVGQGVREERRLAAVGQGAREPSGIGIMPRALFQRERREAVASRRLATMGGGEFP